jgi:hypothetical protein
MEIVQKLGDFAVQYGLGITLSLAIAVYLAWQSKKMFDQQDKIMTAGEKREERLATIIDGTIKNIKEDLTKHDERAAAGLNRLQDSIKELREDVRTANTYHREEHKEMIKALQAISQETIGMKIAFLKHPGDKT